MSNVIGPEKTKRIAAPGRLGRSLRLIQSETGIRRETASNYLKEEGLEVRGPGRLGHARPDSKPAIKTITDAWGNSIPALEVINHLGAAVVGGNPTASCDGSFIG